MKRILAFVLFLFTSVAAFAADVVASVAVKYGDTVIFEQTTKFAGMTDAEVSDLQKSGLKQLDYASRHQDKGGPYTIVWKWNDETAIETSGMKFGAVNATLRQGVKWLDARVAAAESKAALGYKKPWGPK